jgi:taurine dioxygenase
MEPTMSTATATLTFEPLSPVLGARVRGLDLSRDIPARTQDELRAAFAHYGVLCVPSTTSTPDMAVDDQIRFAAVFGKVDAEGNGQLRFAEGEKRPKRGVMFVSNLRENGDLVGVLPDGEMHFHSDGAHREVPYRGTTLYAIKIPSRGGETRFANMTAAYDALAPAMKAKVEGLSGRFVYDVRATLRDQTNEGDEALSSSVHPLVRRHPDTGTPALYLSRLMTRNIVGMERAASDALLGELFDHCEHERFVYAHSWTLGDLLLWDNRCLNHARNDFPAHEDRHLRRVTVSDPG